MRSVHLTAGGPPAIQDFQFSKIGRGGPSALWISPTTALYNLLESPPLTAI
jgi:hypothetical protein